MHRDYLTPSTKWWAAQKEFARKAIRRLPQKRSDDYTLWIKGNKPEEPLAENQQNKEESTTPKEAEVDSKPEDSASPSSESKPQIEPKTKTEDEPKKEKKATTNKSKKEKTSDKKNDS